MRITNTMITRNTKSNINSNKLLVDKYNTQMTTQKKISKASEDPVIAIRSLRLSTTLSHINQYVENNIPDASAWMDVTESALKTVNDIVTSMNSYCNQGANDYPTAEDRDAIATNLEELELEQEYPEENSFLELHEPAIIDEFTYRRLQNKKYGYAVRNSSTNDTTQNKILEKKKLSDRLTKIIVSLYNEVINFWGIDNEELIIKTIDEFEIVCIENLDKRIFYDEINNTYTVIY